MPEKVLGSDPRIRKNAPALDPTPSDCLAYCEVINPVKHEMSLFTLVGTQDVAEDQEYGPEGHVIGVANFRCSPVQRLWFVEQCLLPWMTFAFRDRESLT